MFKYYFCYIFFGVVIFYFGPIKYNIINPIVTFSYILIAYGFLFVGLYCGYKYTVLNKKISHRTDVNNKITYLMLLLILINFINVIDIYSSIGINSFQDATLGTLYYSNLNLDKESGIVTQLITLSYPLTMYLIAYSCAKITFMSLYQKIVFVIFIISMLIGYVLKGNNFGLFLVIIPVVINLILSGNFKFKIISFKNFLVLFFIIYFISNMSSRLDYGNIPYSMGSLVVDRDNIIFTMFPPSLAIGLTAAMTYISQGYYGLSLAFNYPFDSTLGLGGGYFLINKLGLIFDPDIFLRTYQAKMDLIWSSTIQWHTMFVWIANDVSFYVVPFILLFFGFFVGMLYKYSRNGIDILSNSLFSVCAIILIFIPANNIVSGNPLVFMSFWVLLCIWVIRRYSIK